MKGRVAPAWAMACLPVVATSFEGGASVVGLTLWHAALLGLLGVRLIRGPGSFRLASGPATWGWLAFLALAVLGGLVAPYRYAALLTLSELGLFGAWVALAAGEGTDWLRSRAMPLAALTASLQAALAAYQRFALGEPRGAGTFLNPNHAGAWFAMVTLASVALALRDPAGGSLRRWLPAALPALAGLMLTGSKGALVGFGAGLVVALAIAWPRLGVRLRRTVWVAGVAVLLAAGAVVSRRQSEDDPFRFHRVAIWSATAGMIAERPWAGSGPGQYAIEAARHQFDDGVAPLRFDHTFRSAHNDPLQAAAEFGLPAALALLVALVALIRRAWTSVRQRGGPAGAAWVVPALLAPCVQGLVDTPSGWPAVYLLSGAMIGALLSEPRPRTVPGGSVAARLAAALALVLLFLVGDLGPTLAHRSFREAADRDGDEALLDRVLTLNPLTPGPWMARADLAASGSRPALEAYAAAREAAETAIRLSPREGRWHWGLARIEGRACLDLFRDVASLERARRAFERAIAREPTDPRILLDGAEFLIDAGRADEAVAWCERAVALEPESPVAHLHLADALLASGAPSDRVAARLVEARARLERYRAHAADNRYSKELIEPDPERLERVAAAVAGGSGDPTP